MKAVNLNYENPSYLWGVNFAAIFTELAFFFLTFCHFLNIFILYSVASYLGIV